MRFAFAALLIAVLAPAAIGQVVVVDGDLSDIAAVAQGDQSDPFNEICLLAKSGFDLRWVHVFYDQTLDKLYFGLDLMDVPDPDFGGAQGMNGPGVPGDADGDEDPDAATEPACPVQEEQNGVGPDEEYLVKVDTNTNGLFNDFEDIRIIYRGNFLRFEHGDSTPWVGPTGDAILGTAGAPVDPLLPNQNRLTEDIEIVVHDWSTIDPVPTCFIVTTFSGSLVDGFPEDELITPINIQVAQPEVEMLKEVRNVTEAGAFGGSTAVEIGDIVEFRLTLTNSGNVPLDPAAIADSLPGELDFDAGSVTGTTNVFTEPEGGGIKITFKKLGGDTELPVGEQRIVTFQAEVLNTINNAVVNSAEGGGFPPDECAASPASAVDTATVSLVDITCTKEVSLDGVSYFPSVSAAHGQTVHFRVTINNPSSVDLMDVTMVDVLPAGLENINAPGCSVIGQTVTCNVGVLPASQSAVLNFTATVADTASGTLVNTADCTAMYEGTPLETSCDAEVDVLEPDMICDKAVSLDGISYFPSLSTVTGAEVFFRVNIQNIGTAPFFEVTLDDPLPAGFSNISIVSGPTCGVFGQNIFCSNVGPLNPAATVTIIYKATVTATNPPTATLMNTATCVGKSGSLGNPGEEIETSCDASVNILNTCIVCVKEVSSDGVNFGPDLDAQGGDHVWFRVTVTNCGAATLSNVTIDDSMPNDLVNVQTADPNCGVIGNDLSCSLATLDPGNDWEVVYEADIDALATGSIQNTAFVNGTPIVSGVPGDDIATQCSAQINVGPLEIPTLSEWGLILMSSMLAFTLILHNRFRHRGVF